MKVEVTNGVFVGESDGVEVGLAVGESVGVLVGVWVTVFKGVSVGEEVLVLVGVEVAVYQVPVGVAESVGVEVRTTPGVWGAAGFFFFEQATGMRRTNNVSVTIKVLFKGRILR